ncbi:MAG: DUF2156 domain-containing protein [Streptomyces sp.]|uniref:DUF2156 domain-containing protein n=1 Tax=Streptomyces sp. TaxID=1931 RepID=UPI0025DC68FE|nr:DUF2156 domain-containing protein [Streptomyces sp.]MBW8792510.1 DUF2156 domain-containing protein [Streptomyces sp.]
MIESVISDEAASFDFVYNAIRDHAESNNPSSFLAVSQGNSYFTLPGRDGVIVYRPAGPYLVQFGGPFAPDECYRELLDGFLLFAADRGYQVVSVQLQERDARIYAERGFTVNQIGSSYAVDLTTFTLSGTRFMQLRNKISRAFRNGLTVIEADYEEWREAIVGIDRMWLPLKGEGAKQLEYLVGQCGGPAQRYRRLFLGLIDGAPAGYILYSPVYGTRPGWMHDLSRRRPDLSPGLMEAINKTAIDAFLQEQVPWLHFGFTPFTTLDEKVEMPGSSAAFRWFMHFLWENGKDVYPAATQLAYKQKWNQSLVLTEYVAFQGPASVNAFVHIFRAAGAL